MLKLLQVSYQCLIYFCHFRAFRNNRGAKIQLQIKFFYHFAFVNKALRRKIWPKRDEIPYFSKYHTPQNKLHMSTPIFNSVSELKEYDMNETNTKDQKWQMFVNVTSPPLEICISMQWHENLIKKKHNSIFTNTTMLHCCHHWHLNWSHHH